MQITKNLFSLSLEREVVISIIPPINFNPDMAYKLVLFNDGQDFDRLRMEAIAGEMQLANEVPPMLIVGIHANDERIFEYGVAAEADYAGRGNKAGRTTSFVVNELLPSLLTDYRIQEGIVYAGFSLGGLMALDAVWNNPETFSKAGVFSGSLWWRRTALNDGYQHYDRIMHAHIASSARKNGLGFWFQCGSLDEYDDRDGDGVIDSIQDTLECIAELEKKGYVWNRDVFYTEIEMGEHNPETWSAALPAFFKWALAESQH
ncbi:esterase family protein [Dyadobacter sp. CY326]|uniref:alpha/beta hydrolase n=1 Tax=Dyadobacter sp. CY326 TaxID=2907300 RepID=UPI001F3DD93F|nr:alpha/beta hydrolase-fold protein [Dyadobacter sp. CY326]MCE7068462.1 esterase family protein [Dyadobacter sp. CY326]